LTGNLILSGVGAYSFTTPVAITTAASSIVSLTNGASCSNVNWCIGTAATFGASSSFVGLVFAGQAITIGASAIIAGSLTSGNDVVTVGAGAQVTTCQLAGASTPGSCSCLNSQVIAAQLGGQTLAPGCYAAVAGAAFGLTGVLTLAGPGTFTLTTPAAITTAAASGVSLIGGASCSNVKWCIGAAATLGASSQFVGSLNTQAAITLGAGASVRGSVSSAIDTVTYGAGATVTPCAANVPSCSCASPASIPAELGGQFLPPGCYGAVAGAAFGLTGNLILSGVGSYSFATPAAITTAASSLVTLINGASCDSVNWCIGAAATFGASSQFIGHVFAGQAITIGASALISGSAAAGNDVITNGAGCVVSGCPVATNATVASDSCSCAATPIPAQLGGQKLGPGCYSAVGGAAFGLTGALTLSGPGSYSFSTPAAITTAASSAVVLIGGASCSSVKWCIGAAATLGASSQFVGSLRAQAAITLGASSAEHGGVYSAIGVITVGAGAVVTPC
jgi:hypothetical protein